MGIPVEYIVAYTVVPIADLKLSSSRRLGALGRFRIDYQLVLPPEMNPRIVALQASKMLKSGTPENGILLDKIANAHEIELESLNFDNVQTPDIRTARVVVAEEQTNDGGLGLAFHIENENNALEIPFCSDKSDFVDEQEDSCSDWPGFNCSSPKWLRTERPYTIDGLSAVRTMCPVSCGICSPPERPTPADLAEVCADDPFLDKLCSHWRGMNCAVLAPLFGYSRSYTSLLLKRCPAACGLCANPSSCKFPSGDSKEVNVNCEVAELIQVANGSCQDIGRFKSGSLEISCNHFVGRPCKYSTLLLDLRWLSGPRAAAEWHNRLWSQCPLTCALCEPAVRPSPRELQAECEDDPYFRNWCATEWAGRDCSAWRDFVMIESADAARLNATIATRCPRSCATCTEPSCGPGSYWNRLWHGCDLCPKGKFAPIFRSGDDARQCLLSWPGSIVPGVGAVTSARCPPGSFSQNFGSSFCTLCQPGMFSALGGTSICTNCSAGLFQDAEGGKSCNRCPPGSYGTDERSTGCFHCPQVGGMPLTTEVSGSIGDDKCVCPADSYRPSGPFAQCLHCLIGFTCKGGHRWDDPRQDMTVSLLPGYVSMESDPYSAYTCASLRPQSLCEGVRTVPEESIVDAYFACKGGNAGRRCHKCPTTHHLTLDGCAPCLSVASSQTYLYCWTLFSIQFIVFGYVYYTQGEGDASGSQVVVNQTGASRFATVGAASAKEMSVLRTGSSLQGFAILKCLNISWPIETQWMWTLLTPFDYTVYLDVLSAQLQCGSHFSIITYFGVITCLPLFFVLADIAVLVLVLPLFGRKLFWPGLQNTVGTLCAGLFVSISMISMQVFITERMPNGKSFLRFFPGVEVGSDEWLTMVPFGVFAIALYCCSFYAYVLYATIFVARITRHPQGYQRYEFLFLTTRAQCFWWRLMDLTYAFFLSLARVLTEHPRDQIYLIMMAVCTTFIAESATRPFRCTGANFDTMIIKLAMLLFLCAAMPPAANSAFEESGARAVLLITFSCVCLLMVSELWDRRGKRPKLLAMLAISRFKALVSKLIQLPFKEFLAGCVEMPDQDLYVLACFLPRMSFSLFGVTTATATKKAINSLRSRRFHTRIENNYELGAQVARYVKFREPGLERGSIRKSILRTSFKSVRYSLRSSVGRLGSILKRRLSSEFVQSQSSDGAESTRIGELQQYVHHHRQGLEPLTAQDLADMVPFMCAQGYQYQNLHERISAKRQTSVVVQSTNSTDSTDSMMANDVGTCVEPEQRGKDESRTSWV